MKTILYLLSFIITLTLPVVQLKEEFNQDIAKGYEQYVVLDDYQNVYFDWQVVYGINRDKMAYGIFLYNDQPGSHHIEIIINNQKYQPSETHREDYFLLAITMKDDILIRVLDEQNTIRREVQIQYVSVTDFPSTYAQIQTGLNEGLFFNSLSKSLTLLDWIVIIFAGVIVLFGSIIGYMAFSKKGLFKKEARKQDLFLYRDFIQTLPQEAVDLDESEPTISQELQPNPFIDEEEIDLEQAKLLLEEKGYEVQYQLLETAMKDKIMLELMLMRDQGLISKAQYQNEVIELWKK